ncbi:cytochrome P450 [Amycolatopsis australiensis]|uniref:Cytochrome P450 n=1 Tax=Amycolatopsis australiensis TaxID=546364 RepID=A0A1K1RUN2_9PSEU|nr:cytochrome P450 [Amycolatopsis australiensis]SFW75650.1 Cytochrome P450 [Amycolatopsis australiensis]
MTPQEPTSLPVKRSCPFDPPGEYRALQEGGGVTPLAFDASPGPATGWLVTRLADVRAVLADARFSHRNDLVALAVPPPFPMDTYRPEPAAPGAFPKMDGAEHARYRKLVAKYFTVRRTRELVPVAERIARELLDVMAADGTEAELVTAYAEPLATRVMGELAGVPEADREELLHHLNVVARMRYTLEELMAAITVVGGILERLVDAAFETPGDDMLGELASTGVLDRPELVNLVWALVGGGFDTTTNMLALGTFALFEHPAQLARLRAEPALWPNAIEELLRYLTVSHLGASRAALEDVELGEQLIRKGETVVVALPAANRDPERFPDPGTLAVDRATQGHVAFGHGVHQCLGQHLARVTMLVGFRELFARFPELRLAVPPEQVPLRDDMLHYGVHALPVTWARRVL